MRPSLRFARGSAAAALLFVSAGCLKGTEPDPPSNPATDTYAPQLGINISQMTKVTDDLYIQDVVVGTGTVVAATGKTLGVTYTGWLTNGTQFDSNVGKATFPVTLGAGGVIPGWELGLTGMRAGGRRLLVIGSNLGYGPVGNPPIPPNATIVFSVQAVTIQ
jgi:FKBP-type peptidyl-prolyl cis-trans isomerase